MGKIIDLAKQREHRKEIALRKLIDDPCLIWMKPKAKKVSRRKNARGADTKNQEKE